MVSISYGRDQNTSDIISFLVSHYRMTDLSSFLDNILSEFDLSANVISTIKTHLTKEIGVKDVEDLYDVHSKDLPKKGI